MELKENKVKEILKALINNKSNYNRYDNVEQIQNVIVNFLRINLFDLNKFKVKVTKVSEEERQDLKENDYLLVGNIEDLENGKIFDFDIYYTKTRNDKIYPIEYILQ